MVQITKDKVAKYLKNSYHMTDLNTPRKFENAVNRTYEELVEIYNRPLVKEMVIKMEWKNNRHYGWNPSAVALVKYVNGKTTVFEAKAKVASGGYAKDIHVIELLMNKAAKQNLYHKRLSAYKDVRQGLQEVGKGFYVDKSGLFPFYEIGSKSGKFSFFTIDHTVDSQVYDEFVIKFR